MNGFNIAKFGENSYIHWHFPMRSFIQGILFWKYALLVKEKLRYLPNDFWRWE